MKSHWPACARRLPRSSSTACSPTGARPPHDPRRWPSWASLLRRERSARIGRFKSIAHFEWDWPSSIDRSAVMDLMGLGFIKDASNVVIVGPNGVGKSMCAANIAHQAVLAGHTVLFVNAAHMLGELSALDSDSALQRKLRRYAAPQLLVIDEIGYLSYGNRHADLLFQLINARYQQKSTVITTNRAFGEWGEIFPNAACAVSLVDRLVHHCEVVRIEGESYRRKEALERQQQRQSERASRGKAKPAGKAA
jgi:DNA replication protein DnaC